jgi:hypothetical protein
MRQMIASPTMTRAAADALAEEGTELFRAEKFLDAMARFERATQIYPDHALAWKGIGNVLLCMGRPNDAARAFDRAIGLRPDSATALWGGAVAHADTGNRVMAQNYLRRVLVLQPTWIEMARNVPQFATFLRVSTRANDLLRSVFGAFSCKMYNHTADPDRAIEVGRLTNIPVFGTYTFLPVGLSNTAWSASAVPIGGVPTPARPRVELILASTVDTEVCGQILANLAFHLSETSFFPDPNVMVRDVVGGLDAGDLSRRLPHVFLREPKGWSFRLPLDAVQPAISVVQVVPVSETEYLMWKRNVAGFEGWLVQRKIDVSDLRRAGV